MRTRRPPTLPSQPRSQRPRGGPHTQGLAPARGLCGTLLKPTALRRLLALAGLAAFVCMSAMSARLDPFDGGGTGAGKGEGDDGAGLNPRNVEREEAEQEGDHGLSSMLAQLESGKSVEDLALELLHSVREERPKVTDAMLDIANFGAKSSTAKLQRAEQVRAGTGEAKNEEQEEELEEFEEETAETVDGETEEAEEAEEAGDGEGEASSRDEEEERGNEAPALQVARPEPDAEEEEEEEHPRLPARPKAAELMKLAREAAKDADRRKDADVKRVLRQAGVDPAKLTQPAYLSTTLESLRKKASDERARAAARADADNSPNPSSNPDTSTTASASAAAAAAGMTLEWLPTVRSRGGKDCGVCTNGTGGNFARGIGMVVGGGAFNTVQNDKDGYATVGGGRSNKAEGEYATVAGGYGNAATNDDTTVCGGGSNKATQPAATVAGGNDNEANGLGTTITGGANNVAMGASATVGGGGYNKAAGDTATVGGGEYNTASAAHATVAGGVLNSASHNYATVVGGMANAATFNYSTVNGGGYNLAAQAYATVAGGYNNTASGEDAAVLGGASNAASGAAAVVCGGDNNTATGRRSFASGHLAVAAHAGSVVLGDATDNTVRSGRDNQLTVQHGDVRKPGGGAWVAPADRRAMTAVEPFDVGLAALSKLHPVRYEYTGSGLGLGAAGVKFVGLTAQELEAVDDAAFMVIKDKTTVGGGVVKAPGEEHRAVDASALTFMLLNAVNELAARVAALEEDNARLRASAR